MSARVPRQWSDMRPGDFVYDLQGKPHMLVTRNPLGEIILRNPNGAEVNIGRQSGVVHWWDPSPEAETIEGFRQMMGATIIRDSRRSDA